jgi:proteic killer suppression protein
MKSVVNLLNSFLDVNNASRYYSEVILSFACAETEGLFRAELARRIPNTIQRSARRKLLALHAATELRHLTVPPGNRLEALKGNRSGQHSIRINDQWRICFRWSEGNAYEVEIVDYH